jgi:hypothetical protein
MTRTDSPTNMAHSVHDRLMAMAKERNRPFNELLQYFAMERFLYRLSKSPAGRHFVLKGALLLTARDNLPFRPTRDIDLMGKTGNSEDNIWWGGTVEDNSFGTHEFLNLCEILGADAYVSINVGSATVYDMIEWIEYMTSDSDVEMANWRRRNGREEPWDIKFVGIGNESWGCGGDMTPEHYADLLRQYSIFAKMYGKEFCRGRRLFGCGPFRGSRRHELARQLSRRPAGGRLDGRIQDHQAGAAAHPGRNLHHGFA